MQVEKGDCVMFIMYLRYLVMALRLGSMSKAAKAFNTTHQTISAGITSVEKQLGAKLVVRGQQGIELTDQGKEILPYINTILDAYDEIEEHLKQAPDESQMNLIIYYPPSCSFFMANALENFTSKHPSLSLQCFEGNRADIRNLLSTEKNSLSIVQASSTSDFSEFGDNLKYWKLPFLMQMCVVVSRNHPLAKKKVVLLTELAKYPLCMYLPYKGSPFYESLASLVDVSYSVETDNMGVYCKNIACGDNVAILPRINNRTLRYYENIPQGSVYLPVEEYGTSHIVCLVNKDIDSAYLNLYHILSEDFSNAVFKQLM